MKNRIWIFALAAVLLMAGAGLLLKSSSRRPNGQDIRQSSIRDGKHRDRYGETTGRQASLQESNNGTIGKTTESLTVSAIGQDAASPRTSPSLATAADPSDHWLDVAVVDRESVPIEGVRIEASSAALHDGATSTVAVTNAKGYARFTSLGGERINLKLTAEGWLPETPENLAADQMVYVTLRRDAVILGRAIEEESGDPVTHFSVAYQASGLLGIDTGTQKREVYAPDGRFALEELSPPAAYKVLVEAKDSSRAIERGLRPVPRAKAKETIFYLTNKQKFEGVVVDSQTSAPLAGVAVTSAFYEEKQVFDWNNLTDGNPSLSGVNQSVTGADGVFTFEEGTLYESTLFITANGYGRRMIRPYERFGLPRDSEGRLVAALGKGASVRGICLKDGIPAPGARLSLYRIDLEWNEGLEQAMLTTPARVHFIGMTQTDQAGAYRWESIEAGRYQISVLGEEGAFGFARLARRFELAVGEDKELNLGDGLGAASLYGKLTFADGTPVAWGLVTLAPAFQWEYSEFGSATTTQGGYRIDGLLPGTYRVNLSGIDPATKKTVESSETVTLDGTLEHDFVLDANYHVTARLVYPEGATEAFRNLFVQAAVFADADSGQSGGFTQSAICSIAGGRLEFRGRFKGNYHIGLSPAELDDMTRLPQTFGLDNLSADQDLGDILVPMTGHLRLVVAYDPWPDSVVTHTATLEPTDGRSGGPVSFSLTSDKPDALLGPLDAGSYRISAGAAGYSADPTSATVTIDPFQTQCASFILKQGQR